MEETEQNTHIKEFDAIIAMIKFAEKEGLLVEVIWSAMNEISGNSDVTIEQACEFGLSEWDI